MWPSQPYHLPNSNLVLQKLRCWKYQNSYYQLKQCFLIFRIGIGMEIGQWVNHLSYQNWEYQMYPIRHIKQISNQYYTIYVYKAPQNLIWYMPAFVTTVCVCVCVGMGWYLKLCNPVHVTGVKYMHQLN